MEIETTEDLADQIADWIGVYGACNEKDCNKQLCCRQGFSQEMIDRIKQSVKNDELLSKKQNNA